MTAPSSSPVLDRSVLVALRDSVGGDGGFVADLVETYLVDAGEQIGAIEAALAARDAEALVRPAHTLKSASFTVGATRLGELSRELEQRARGGSLDGVADAGAVREALAATEEALRAWLAGEAAT